MTDFGVTDAGFVRKRFEDIDAETSADLRSRISKKLGLTEKTALGNVKNTVNDQLTEAWEAIEAAYYAADPANADDAAFVAVCELTGTKRRGAQNGFVDTTCVLGASKSFAAGQLVAHVEGAAGNRWVNRDPVTSTSAGAYPVRFISESKGAAATCESGTLTVIAQPVDGWVSVTNALAAEPGKDIESIEDLAVRREQELQGAGSGPLASIRAAVSKVPGVIAVRARQNKTMVAGVLPPKSFQIIVWDGVSPAASDDEIAQAILDNGPSGIESIGSSSGIAVDDDGNEETINFERATQVPIWIDVTVAGGSESLVKAQLLAEGAKLTIGSAVNELKFHAAPLAVEGVTDVQAFAIDTVDPPVGTVNVPIDFTSIAVFDAARIAVTVV